MTRLVFTCADHVVGGSGRGSIGSRLLLLMVLALPAAVIAGAKDPPPEFDELTGMRIAPGWEAVRNNCIACHSAQQFLQQHGSRNTWDAVITWMQQRGGLWPLDEPTRNTILDYLVEFHGPKGATRRPPIPAHLMPPNPLRRPTVVPSPNP